MKYVSSRNKNEIVESHNAIIQGLAKDGGLFTPENINIHINVDELTNLSYQQIATKVIHAFLDDFTEEEISSYKCIQRYCFDIPSAFIDPVLQQRKSS